jgi:8-hydroxy-5-deazaflavin:NADPH oxidoreductase
MNITLLGAGNMGSALASQLSRAGHPVRIVARTPDKAQAVAAANPGVSVFPAEAATDGADVVIVATGFGDAIPALKSLGSLAGKVIVDITNPLNDDYSGLTIGHATSAAEEIAKAFPEAEVVKAFNTLFAQVLAKGPKLADGQVATAFYAGDSARAKQTARVLIDSIGFKAVDAGGLKNARYLEPLAGLNIWFGYGAGLGTAMAPTWVGQA